jgi:carboxypeptidase T
MIRKIILSVIVFFSITAVNAQTLKYHKVLMQGDEHLAKTLLKLGITIDHSDVQEGGIAAEISDSELQVLKSNGVKHKILIYDLATFYEARNKAEIAGKSSALPPAVCNAPNIGKPTYFHLGTMGGYFTWNEMKQILDSMALLYPNLISVKQALTPQSIEGRDIYWVKISDNPNVDEAEPEVLYTALHHAREAASLSQLIFYMWYLLENYATNPDIKATVDNSELFFIPCVNPDGYVYNQTTNPNGGGMWRKNRRNNGSTFGVDLNRNYADHWGFDNVGSSPTSSSDTYRGTAAFSEPETQAVRNFCNTRQFATALNAHTYSNLLIYPWGYLPSIYTPDSATFVNWSVLLTEDSRFLYGTGDQTVNYVTNGDSDDWMYGEQTTKPKILAMTPEAGAASDGFWPLASRIIDICKTTFTQNYNLAKCVTQFAIAKDTRDKFLSGNGYLNYNLQRLGLQAGIFTVSIVPVGGDISSVGAPKIYSTLVQNQTIQDSISFILNTGLTPGQTVKYAIGVNNGAFTHLDTVTKIYGTPITLVLDNGNSTTTNYTTSGTWGLSSTKFVSPPNSITESPTGNYTSNQTKSITLKNPMNLSNALYAHLQYYTRFELEKDGDKAQILITTNNGTTWTPLCGRYETSPASFGGTIPIYDGFQDAFVKEDIDLSLYLGQTIKLRFLFNSDPSINKDGFYFDDLWIRVISSGPVGVVKNILLGDNIVLSPNPSNGNFNLSNPDGIAVDVTVYNSLGQLIYQQQNNTDLNSNINIENQLSGIYFVKLKTGGEEVVKKIVIEK